MPAKLNYEPLQLSIPAFSATFKDEVTTVSREVIMFELFEKAVMTGLGAISLSQKKAEEFLAELKQNYKISEEEGKAFLDKVQAMSKEGRERISEMTDAEVKKAIERAGLVSREEFNRLQLRVAALEKFGKETEPGEPC